MLLHEHLKRLLVLPKMMPESVCILLTKGGKELNSEVIFNQGKVRLRVSDSVRRDVISALITVGDIVAHRQLQDAAP